MITLSTLVGKRLRVYWEADGQWFEGVAKSFSKFRGLLIIYDDGDQCTYSEEHLPFEYEVL